MRLYEPAIPNDQEGERFAMRVDIAARHCGLADIELAGQAYNFAKVRLAAPEIGTNPLRRHEELGCEAIGFQFHFPSPIGSTRVLNPEVVFRARELHAVMRTVTFDQEVAQLMSD